MFKVLTNNKVLKNPYILFLPFLMYYVFYVIQHHTNAMIGDESRYYQYAQNLLQGFYASKQDDMYLWNGPGYPIFLMPFVYFKTPLLVITLSNALLQYFSVIYLFNSIKIVTNYNKALLFGLFWAIAFGAYTHMQSILTESLSYFLMSVFIYSSILVFHQKKKKYILLTGFILGYLALTKIIFGYIILSIIIGSFVFWIFNIKQDNYKTSLLIGIIAIVTSLPYLAYTQNLTGRFFYWSNSGGVSLYWMSTPFENEYGDWNNIDFTANNPAISNANHRARLSANHQYEMNKILQYKGVERDDAFKKMAIKNIQNHPQKYLKNILSNLSRMLFNVPNSYANQKLSKLVWHSGILLILLFLSFVLTVIYWKRIEYSIRFLIAISLLYVGGSALVSSDYRLFSPIIPILLMCIAYVMHQTQIFKNSL